jgi:hypothetical protein
MVKAPSGNQEPARNFKRLDSAAKSYGISVSLLKKLLCSGRLKRFKLGRVTMVDTVELESLIAASVANDGREAAPRFSV